jgi:hypothetical protein
VIAAQLPELGQEILIAIWPLLAWLVAILVVARRQRTIELDTDGVRIRSWLERWRGRPGVLLGAPAALRARLASRLHLEIDRPTGPTIEISLALWPHTARQDLVDELPIWGADCAFDQHRHRHDRGHRRRKARATATRL